MHSNDRHGPSRVLRTRVCRGQLIGRRMGEQHDISTCAAALLSEGVDAVSRGHA
jgi:hypothetical protein